MTNHQRTRSQGKGIEPSYKGNVTVPKGSLQSRVQSFWYQYQEWQSGENEESMTKLQRTFVSKQQGDEYQDTGKTTTTTTYLTPSPHPICVEPASFRGQSPINQHQENFNVLRIKCIYTHRPNRQNEKKARRTKRCMKIKRGSIIQG